MNTLVACPLRIQYMFDLDDMSVVNCPREVQMKGNPREPNINAFTASSPTRIRCSSSIHERANMS